MFKYPKAGESRQTEMALQESEEQFRSAMENSPIGMGLVAPDGRWLNVNQALCQITGYSRSEFLASNFQAITHRDDLEADLKNIQRILNREINTYRMEKRYLHKQGHLVWILLNVSLVRHTGGEPRYFIAHIQDITERKQNEELLRRDAEILSQLDDAVVGCDIQGRVVSWNSGAEKLFGWKKEELLGRHIAERFPGEIKPKIFQLMESVFAGQTQPGEWEDYRKDGSRVWVYWRSRVLFDADGKINGMVAVATDIHARKIAEAQIHLLAHAVQTSSELISITDLENRFTFVNNAFLETYGYAESEILGQTPEMLISPRMPPQLQEIIMQTARHTSWSGELLNRRKDGSDFPIYLNASPVLDASGNIIGLLGVAHDITERKQYEDRLREQAELLDKAQDAILVKNLKGQVLYWNKSAERLHGWTATEVQGRCARQFLHKDATKSGQALETVVQTGAWSGEFKNHTKGGGEVLVESRWTLVRDASGQPKSILSINTDITEKKKFETQFFRNQRLESIGTLACGISHDLNNVLTPILISIPLLSEKITDPEGAGILERLEINAMRGADIVRQVLSFGRGVQGELMSVQPNHLLREIEYIIRETFPKAIQIKSQLEINLSPVLGDPTQLHQVLLNLCLNARDAMPAGGILELSASNVVLTEVNLRPNTDCVPGNYVRFEVKDTGAGIPAEIREQIFDPFFTTKEPGKGTGLGLFTALCIIKSHGGFIHLQSEPGHGSLFQIFLPASKVEPQPKAASATAARLSRGNGELILVVDDEQITLDVTSSILQHYGYQVTTALDGVSAVEVYARQPGQIAIVLLDMMMPVMDGRTTVQALKKINPAVKILGATGVAATTGTIGFEESDLEHCLFKPYTSETLLTTLHELLHEGK